MKVAHWNVRTMLDKANSRRLECHSALIAHELSRLNIDIAALNEVRLADQGSFQDVGAGFTLFWSWQPSTDRHLLGIGLMVRNSIASKQEISPMCHYNRIISIRLPLISNQHLTLLSVYAPTLMVDPAVKDSFYSDLHGYLITTLANDMVLILGNFNARVGRDSLDWEGILGRHGVGN